MEILILGNNPSEIPKNWEKKHQWKHLWFKKKYKYPLKIASLTEIIKENLNVK